MSLYLSGHVTLNLDIPRSVDGSTGRVGGFTAGRPPTSSRAG
jgi:hypothetical protein